LLKETTEAFDGARSHDLQASTDSESDLLGHSAPLKSYIRNIF